MIPLPCPFCGLEWDPMRAKTANGTHTNDSLQLITVSDGVNSIAVFCPRCWATGPKALRRIERKNYRSTEQTETEACRLWNERTPLNP